MISVAVAATTNRGYTDSNEVKGYVQIDPDYYRELRDSSPGSEIKYSLTNDPYDWKNALNVKTAVSANPSVTVYVGLFNDGALDTTSVRTLTVPVYRGLTTNVGGHATPEGITISFDMNDGSANGADFSPVVAKTGDLYYSVIPDPDTVTPKRAGYNFVGWKLDDDTTLLPDSKTSDLILIRLHTINYSIFKDKGGHNHASLHNQT